MRQPLPLSWFAAALLLATALSVSPGVAADAAAPAAAEAGARIPTVSVIEAAPREIARSVIVTGTLVPFEEVQVPADIDGFRIREILVEAGDHVEKGQVLARLDTDMLDVQIAQNDSQLARAVSAIAQARGSIAEAEAAKTQADAALKRATELTGRGVVAQDVLDQRTQAADAANARLIVARNALIAAQADQTLVEAQRRELDLRRAKTEIRAPEAGLVLDRSARLGAIATMAGGALFRIAKDGRIELEAEASEVVLADVREGQTVTVVPAGASQAITGTVRLVDPEINRDTRLGTLRVSLPEDPGARIGAFARGTVVVDRSDGLAVPVTAVQTKPGGEASVQIVTSGVVETRPVRRGLEADGYVEIREGLKAGDRIVARAGTFLRNGDKVAPVVKANEEIDG